MAENTKTPEALSRRKALRRIGAFAAGAYAVPAFTTLSMARASSAPSAASEPSAPSEASAPSQPSKVSEPSLPSTPSPSDIRETCGAEDLSDATYAQCVIDNGGTLPADSVITEVPATK